MPEFFVAVMVFYFLLLIVLAIGRQKSWRTEKGHSTDRVFISILVPFRNEAKVISKLIASLRQVDYPVDRFEIIFINDQSEDDGPRVVSELLIGLANAILIDSEGVGKKQAISSGIKRARGKIIVTTDADCQVNPGWLHCYNTIFGNEKVHLAFGGVSLIHGNNFFQHMVHVEWSSVIAVSASSIGLGFFTMCNGANLAYRRDSFQKVNGYEGDEHVPSGDDEFLARKILSMFPGSIRFLHDGDATVVTHPPATLHELIAQRIRWASKWQLNSGVAKLMAPAMVIFHFSFAGVIVAALSGFVPLGLAIVLALIKMTLEVMLMLPVSRFLNLRWSWLAFLAWQFLYPIYVLGVGVGSLTGRYEWKGRRLHN